MNSSSSYLCRFGTGAMALYWTRVVACLFLGNGEGELVGAGIGVVACDCNGELVAAWGGRQDGCDGLSAVREEAGGSIVLAGQVGDGELDVVFIYLALA